jgi:hypothetical protein
MARKITDTVLEKLKAPAAGRLYIWDSKLTGFHVRVTPSGTKTFGVSYRSKAGIKRTMRIADVDSIHLQKARDAAKAILDDVALGKDPALEWKAMREAATVADLFDQRPQPLQVPHRAALGEPEGIRHHRGRRRQAAQGGLGRRPTRQGRADRGQ